MAYRLVPNRHLPPERFIHAWQTSPSVAEAARRLARKTTSVKVTATFMRQLGVPLKLFQPPSGRPTRRQPGVKSRRTLRLIRLAKSYGWAVQA